MQTKYLQLPNEEQRENARREVNATAESVKRDVQVLMEWLEKQPHLPNFKDEDVLSYFLLNCKNSLEKTKHKLETYFTSKALLPEIFRNQNAFEKELETQKDIAMMFPLPKLTPDGYRVLILYLSDEVKTTHYPTSVVHNFFKLSQMTLDLMAKLDYSKGVIAFHDATNVGMPTVVTFSSQIPKQTALVEKAMPGRYKKFYFFNMGRASEMLITAGKSILKKKLADRIEILKNSSDICKYLPKKMIPQEYGGEELSLKTLKDLWFEELKNHNEYFLAMEKYSADLTKVPKDSASTELSGMVGSFRQISFD